MTVKCQFLFLIVLFVNLFIPNLIYANISSQKLSNNVSKCYYGSLTGDDFVTENNGLNSFVGISGVNPLEESVPSSLTTVSDIFITEVENRVDDADGSTFIVGQSSSTGNVDTPLTASTICFAFLLFGYVLLLLYRGKHRTNLK